jgi:Ni,Fe-hydrogenase maturation factor
MRVKVIGVGNPWATDDAVGLMVVQQLQAEYSAENSKQGLKEAGQERCEVTFATLPQASHSLIDDMVSCEVLILVDAVCSGAAPGTVHCETWCEGRRTAPPDPPEGGEHHSRSPGAGGPTALQRGENTEVGPLGRVAPPTPRRGENTEASPPLGGIEGGPEPTDLLAPRGTERASSHGLGVREALALASVLGRLPHQVILWGIEVVCTEPGEGLSPAVAAAVPIVVGMLRRALAQGQATAPGGHRDAPPTN